MKRQAAKLLFGRAAEVLATGPQTVAGSLDSVELPIPPSTNNLFFTKGRKRIKTQEYRDWTERALPILRGLRTVPGPVCVVVRVSGKINCQRDLDNFLKPIGDAMKAAGAFPGDSVKHVTRWDVRYAWKSKGAEPRVLVRLETDKGEE